MKKSEQKPLTNKASQIEIVTMAVYLLGGDRHPVDTEDVAVKAHSLAPTRFSWRKHPEQINLELIRVYLSDAKKTDKGALLDGSGKTGWSLTPKGLKWAKEEGSRVLGKDMERTREEGGGGSIDEQRWRRERDRIVGTAAWASWKAGSMQPSVKEAREVFRIDSYAVGRMKTLKLTRLRSLFDDDDEMKPFLSRMADILAETGES